MMDFTRVEGSVSMHWGPHDDEPFRIARDFDIAAENLENFYPALSAARQLIAIDIRRHFDEGIGPDGPWAPLAGSVESGIEGDTGYRIGGPSHLTKTGAGRAVASSVESFSIEAGASQGEIYFSADPPDFMLTHNRGAMDRETYGGFWEGPNPLPKREWLYLSGEAQTGIFEIFDSFVADATAVIVSPTGGTVMRGPGGMFTSVATGLY
jgi:hypothetical protein